MALSWIGVCRAPAVVVLYGYNPVLVRGNTCAPTIISTKLRSPLGSHFSSSNARLGFGRQLVSRLQWANNKYEHFLQRHFPRFYTLYQTFKTGFTLLLKEGKEIRSIKMKMVSRNIPMDQLPYREMEKLRQFRRDLMKAVPLVLISIPPFANYLVFVLMYFYPRQLLIRHFWSEQQKVKYSGVYHTQRAQSHKAILMGLQRAVPDVPDDSLQTQLVNLCNKVQKGQHPPVSEIHAVRLLFSGPPLGIKRLDVDQMRLLSTLLFLTPRLPGIFISRRLRHHALELLQLDRALCKLGVNELSEAEIRQACYLRGLNVSKLSASDCYEWLLQWLQLSTKLKDSEVSLLLHSMVFLSANYPRASSQ